MKTLLILTAVIGLAAGARAQTATTTTDGTTTTSGASTSGTKTKSDANTTPGLPGPGRIRQPAQTVGKTAKIDAATTAKINASIAENAAGLRNGGRSLKGATQTPLGFVKHFAFASCMSNCESVDASNCPVVPDGYKCCKCTYPDR